MIDGHLVLSPPAGRAAESFAQPWHCAGDFLAIEFWAAPEAIAAALGTALTPDRATCGHAWALFADWQLADVDEVRNPSLEQYREFCVLLDARWHGTSVATRSHVHVDQASAMARGRVCGYPTKLGVVSLTRSFATPGRASATLVSGARLSGSLSVCGERQAEATIRLRKSIGDASQIMHRPTVSLRQVPQLAVEGGSDRPSAHELVMDVARDVRFANAWSGEAELHFPKSSFKELDALAPLRTGIGYRWSMSCAVSDVRVLESFIDLV